MPTVLELYEKLKPKLGEAEARSLLEFIETSVEQRAATKADLQRTESVLREEMHATAASLREEMHKIRAELIKWSFAFWIGNIAVLSGIMFALFGRGR
nr:hypothetical protein [Bryobacteraceae bacterium]